jgi:hypothetical protein
MRRVASLFVLVAILWSLVALLQSQEVIIACADYADRPGRCVEYPAYFVWTPEMTSAAVAAPVLLMAAVLAWRRREPRR